MKKHLWVAAGLVFLILGICLFHGPTKPGTPAAHTVPLSQTAPVPVAAVVPNTPNFPTTAIPMPAQPATAPTPNDLSAKAGIMVPVVADTNAPQTPSAILESMHRVIHSYNTEFGENPVGNNAEITAALMGNNPRHLNLIQPDTGLQVNGNGELVDAWGTPFFFHQLSGQDMEIHSAGPDRIMWTSDDLVSH